MNRKHCVSVLFLACVAALAFVLPLAAKSICVYNWEGAIYKDKPTEAELKEQPALFGNDRGLYLLRSDKTDDGGPAKPGEVRNLIAAGYYGWDEGNSSWEKNVEYRWYVYNRRKKERIEGADTCKYAWTAPVYDPSSEAANTYTVTCVATVVRKDGDKANEVKEGISWILWVESP